MIPLSFREDPSLACAVCLLNNIQQNGATGESMQYRENKGPYSERWGRKGVQLWDVPYYTVLLKEHTVLCAGQRESSLTERVKDGG